MNRVSDEDIMKKVQNAYNQACEQYSEDRILGVFTKGLMNYGFYEEGDKFEFIAIYMPSFMEICTDTYITNEKYMIDDYSHLHIIDIRIMYKEAIEQGAKFLETVYTPYRIYNQKYEETVHRVLLPHRETILHYDTYARYKYAQSEALKAMIEEDYLKANRLIIAIELYIQGEKCEDCLCLKRPYHIDYLWRIKDGKVDNIKEKTKEAFDKLPDSEPSVVNSEADSIFKNAIMELMKISLRGSNNTINFIKSLTTKEKICLEVLKNTIYSEGNISVAEMAAAAHCSRPVFKNLLDKMEKYNIAIIKNQGAKGTYIRFFNIEEVNKCLKES